MLKDFVLLYICMNQFIIFFFNYIISPYKVHPFIITVRRKIMMHSSQKEGFEEL